VKDSLGRAYNRTHFTKQRAALLAHGKILARPYRLCRTIFYCPLSSALSTASDMVSTPRLMVG
jgi:hypothetical protein